MQGYTGDKGGSGAKMGFRGCLLVAVLLSAGLHALAVSWWLRREVAVPMSSGAQTMEVELLAPLSPASAKAAPEPPKPEPRQPEPPQPQQAEPRPLPEDLHSDEKLATRKPVQPTTPKPSQPPRQPAVKAAQQGTTQPAAAPVRTTAPEPTQAAITPPRHDAAYLNNAPPVYPAISRRLGEEGQVLLHMRISATGKPVAVTIKQSSGFSRLDEAARKTAEKWRFVPAQQGGVAIESDVDVPVLFGLKQ